MSEENNEGSVLVVVEVPGLGSLYGELRFPELRESLDDALCGKKPITLYSAYRIVQTTLPAQMPNGQMVMRTMLDMHAIQGSMDRVDITVVPSAYRILSGEQEHIQQRYKDLARHLDNELANGRRAEEMQRQQRRLDDLGLTSAPANAGTFKPNA